MVTCRFGRAPALKGFSGRVVALAVSGNGTPRYVAMGRHAWQTARGGALAYSDPRSPAGHSGTWSRFGGCACPRCRAADGLGAQGYR